MSIPVKCECGRSFKVGDSYAGRDFLCPACNGAVSVPIPSLILPIDTSEPVSVFKPTPAPARSDYPRRERLRIAYAIVGVVTLLAVALVVLVDRHDREAARLSSEKASADARELARQKDADDALIAAQSAEIAIADANRKRADRDREAMWAARVKVVDFGWLNNRGLRIEDSATVKLDGGRSWLFLGFSNGYAHAYLVEQNNPKAEELPEGYYYRKTLPIDGFAEHMADAYFEGRERFEVQSYEETSEGSGRGILRSLNTGKRLTFVMRDYRFTSPLPVGYVPGPRAAEDRVRTRP